jgi:transposase
LRKSVLDQVLAGQATLVEAALRLGLSYRHAKRVFRRYRQEGDRGLVHRGRGRASPRRTPSALREAILEVCREELSGLGPTLAAEKLAERGYRIDHETLRRWLIADGQWRRCRKRPKHRTRRERKARFGELLQLDGSHHAWFGEDHPQTCLMNLVDDATGRAMTWMADEETTEAAMRILWKWVARYGRPRALYLDRKSVYLAYRPPTTEEQLAEQEPLTHFGRACQKLGIVLIPAHSPQAKGRVERKHGVYQDRLVHELRLQGITTVAGANRLLESGFDKRLNEKFAKPPRQPQDAHRPVPQGLDLRHVFCLDESRTVANDWTVSYRAQVVQILKLNAPLPKPGDKILVRTWLDGQVHFLFRDHPLHVQCLQKRPPKPVPKPSPRPARVVKYKPASNHPWRRARVRTPA